MPPPTSTGPTTRATALPDFALFLCFFGTNTRRGESSDRGPFPPADLTQPRGATRPSSSPARTTPRSLGGRARSAARGFHTAPLCAQTAQPPRGELRGKKRKGRPRAEADDSAVREPRRKAFISKETGRRVRTTLTLQQTRVLQDKFEEQKHWNPKQCAAMLPNLNQLGPDLAVEQVIRWFDNRRRTLKARGRFGPGGVRARGWRRFLEDEGVEPSAKKSGAVRDEKRRPSACRKSSARF